MSSKLCAQAREAFIRAVSRVATLIAMSLVLALLGAGEVPSTAAADSVRSVSSTAASVLVPTEADDAARWQWPVSPALIVGRFRAPANPYAAGHRGIDLRTHPGQQVVAPAAGVVRFVGTVVDRPVLSLQLDSGLIVTLEPVETQVTAGEAFGRGQAVGTVGHGGHCADHCLHIGVVLDERYLSPMRYFGALERSRLLPLYGGAAASEATTRADGLGDRRR